MKYVCNLCGYVYDEAAGDPGNGISPGTKWESIPDDFVCPICGAGKDEFSPAQRNSKIYDEENTLYLRSYGHIKYSVVFLQGLTKV